MSTPARPKPPAPECPPNLIGPCTSCQHPCQRYGNGGSPLCVLCQADLETWRATQGKAKPGRP